MQDFEAEINSFNNNTRCFILQEPKAIQDASVEGSANTHRGFGKIVILLLGVITIMFS